MNVELLYSPGCPNLEPARLLLADVLRQAGLEVLVREVAVWDLDQAVRLEFPGSPTIRVDGVDVAPDVDAQTEYTIRCRLYDGTGIPPREFLEKALRTETPR